MDEELTVQSFTIDAIQENLNDMIDYVSRYAQLAGLSRQECYDVQLGCEEVFNNIIHYAYPEGVIGQVEISCRTGCDSVRLGIIVNDTGVAFNPLQLPMPDITAPVEKRCVGGLGIFLLKKMFDTIEYQRFENTNILKLYKK
jgi:anti-sigma regulatory factor (Ser/Thr protein kinase)